MGRETGAAGEEGGVEESSVSDADIRACLMLKGMIP